ncbi:MAG TPA: hypothetical protein VJN96_04460 [Vicinamibacterales bacterium]|nr:hypothetical protein [Vicinamibacterales bacterium]
MTNALRTTLALSAPRVLACAAQKASGSQTDASDPAPGASSAADASWSATIDGVAVTGKGVDPDLQQRNAAYVLPRQGPGEKHVVFTLFDTKGPADNTADISIAFHFPLASLRTGNCTRRCWRSPRAGVRSMR